MNFADPRVLLDVVFLVLLIGTIVYAIKLNRNLGRLRDARAELDGLVKELSASAARAELAIQGMKRTATEAGGDIQKQIDVARALADELHIMNEFGNNLAQRLERASRASRVAVEIEKPATSTAVAAPRSARPETGQGGSTKSGNAAALGSGAADKMTSRAERELFAAIETARRGNG